MKAINSVIRCGAGFIKWKKDKSRTIDNRSRNTRKTITVQKALHPLIIYLSSSIV